ncbi:coiled-coil domain-containing protein [Arhodomonas sp. SL1]|uniref:coiled-coil domain-containing protein n=1 Tax=Arhodomonas sp. SL1 TaxID=3425691 RepID=UPI003F88035C
MTSLIELYEQLSSAPDEKTRARLVAEAFERMEERYPEVRDLATQAGMRETELRLQKEIEQVRADLKVEIEQVRADLSKEIEQVRGDLSKEIEQVRADLSKEIEQVRAELKVDIEQVRSDVLRWVVTLLAGQTAVILAALYAMV